jgi:metal-sulfur cluster biosynthetic enzyme
VITQARVLAALATVHDPELDEPITSLGFVGSCVVSRGGDVDVHLRLPTPQCAPNFAFLMAADAREAVVGVRGARRVVVVLDDHYTADEINAAVARGGGFGAAFPGESSGDLDALRDLFRRKALLARQGRVCTGLLARRDRVRGGDRAGRGGPPGRGEPAGRGEAAGSDEPGGRGEPADHAAVVALRVADLPADDPEVARCLELRRELGLPCGPDAPAIVGGDGCALTVDQFPRWLRRAQLVSLSLESNGGLCRSLLRVRHGVPDQTEEVAA